MQQHIYDAIPGRIVARNQMVQIKGEEREFPQMKRIKEMIPVRRVCYVRIIRNQNIVKMKWIVE